jgi:hypothetical protein
MKTSRSLFAPVILFIFLISFFSCKHKAETIVVTASPFVGQWKGTTWQNRPVTISVAQVDTGIFITSYDFSVKNDSSSGNDTLHLSRKSDNGMALVGKDSSFSVPIANVDASFEYIKGKFNLTNMTISGDIKVVFQPNFDVMTGVYTATKQE